MIGWEAYMNKIPLIIILGPTAVGKTEIAIELAKRIDGEIISADSMQIYRYMDIGTAKPDLEERQGIPHHLLDVVYPDENFNVSIYKDLAIEKIRDIYSRGKIPILAGGTGLYVNSLIYPLNFTKVARDKEYRDSLEKEVENRGKEWLHKQLQGVDPKTASRLHPNDVRRIIRALEVYHTTGKPISRYSHQDQQKNEHMNNDGQNNNEYAITLIGLSIARDKLYDRINKRVDMMLENGLIDEVKWLIENGYNKDLNSMQGLGYKEIIQYLMGRRTLTESIYILKRDTRRFAKRQLTWFKRLTYVNWIDMDEFNKDGLVDYLVDNIIKSK